MVPIAELSAQRSAPTESTLSSFTDFPPWTRGDESESEAEHDEAKRRLGGFRGRSRRRRDASVSQLGRDNDDDTSPSSAHSIFKRGALKGLLEPVVNNLVGAAKGGSSSDEKGPTSDDSGHETDHHTDHEAEHASSSTYKRPPPETTEPARIVGSPTSYPAHHTPPPPPPPPPPSQPPQISTDAKATSTPSAGPSSPTGGQTPKKPPPVNNANSKYSPSSTSYEATKSLNITSSTVMPESTTSVLLTITTPTPSSRSLISLTPIVTPIITGPIPVLSSGVRKGVEAPPTEVPIVLVTKPTLSTSTTTASYSYETAEPDEMKEYSPHPHDDLHANTEKALIAVGSVGATIIIFFVFWLAWKCFKMRGSKGGSRARRPRFTASPSLDKPKRLMMDLASRVPILKKRFAKRSWSNIDKPYDDAYWEKKLPEPDAGLESPRGITVHTAISKYEEDKHASARGHGPNQSISSTQPQFNQTLRSNYQAPHNRMSDISSLSSGFGDGDIIVPPTNSNTTTITATHLAVPAPIAQRSSVSGTSQRRDTVYTEASEDPQPRFRTVNSWVRQQTGRVKRAKQREMVASDAPPVPNMPPEQEFRLMMPDEEEPRRALTG